jgi:hypothetical protein
MRLLRTPALLGVALVAGLALAACGSGSSAQGVKKLIATPYVQQQLLAAIAALHNLTVSDYTGLAPGATYYAYDPSDHLYWAGAADVPSPTSTAAQVSSQDDGGYYLFTRTATSWWTVYSDGLGNVPGSSCGIVTPKAVRTVWGWSLTTPCGEAPHV